MKWLNKLLGNTASQRTLLDEFEEKGGKVLVAGYRRYSKEHGGVPTEKTSDREIIEIYKKVGTAFRDASAERQEFLPALNLNYIVLTFLQIKETMESGVLDSHLRYEVQKYRMHGLRDDYKRELSLFDEPPRWHTDLPKELQYSCPELIRRLDSLRQDMGIGHESFRLALMRTKNLLWRKTVWVYDCAKQKYPNLSEDEYMKLVIKDRIREKIDTLPFNTCATAWTMDQLQKILDNVDSFAKGQNIRSLFRVFVNIEEYEHSFTDPLGVIAKIDEIYQESAKHQSI